MDDGDLFPGRTQKVHQRKQGRYEYCSGNIRESLADEAEDRASEQRLFNERHGDCRQQDGRQKVPRNGILQFEYAAH